MRNCVLLTSTVVLLTAIHSQLLAGSETDAAERAIRQSAKDFVAAYDETTLLVHLGKDKTEQWTLVRLKDPKGQK